MEPEKAGTDDLIYKAEIETHREHIYSYRGGKAGWDELGDWE